jgi:hypothetical protein
MVGFALMVRGSPVPEPNPAPIDDASRVVTRVRRSLKFLRAYAVGVVNIAAVLYIVFKVVVVGIRRLTE